MSFIEFVNYKYIGISIIFILLLYYNLRSINPTIHKEKIRKLNTKKFNVKLLDKSINMNDIEFKIYMNDIKKDIVNIKNDICVRNVNYVMNIKQYNCLKLKINKAIMCIKGYFKKIDKSHLSNEILSNISKTLRDDDDEVNDMVNSISDKFIELINNIDLFINSNELPYEIDLSPVDEIINIYKIAYDNDKYSNNNDISIDNISIDNDMRKCKYSNRNMQKINKVLSSQDISESNISLKKKIMPIKSNMINRDIITTSHNINEILPTKLINTNFNKKKSTNKDYIDFSNKYNTANNNILYEKGRCSLLE